MYSGKLKFLSHKVAMTSVPVGDDLFGCTIIKFHDTYVTCIKSDADKTVYTVGTFKISDGRKYSERFLNLKQHGLHGKFKVFHEIHLPNGADKFVLDSLNKSYNDGACFKIADLLRLKSSIDVVGVTIGKGFAGVMKKFGFGGLPASHGTSASHRSVGSTGSRIPKHTFKGRPMPGRLGCSVSYIKNLSIVEVIDDENVIIVKGSVPGHKGSALYILS